MSFLVAIEGADGAGKATAAEYVCKALSVRGLSATVISFPRYRETIGGFALGEFLGGRVPVPGTPRAAAVLYALDRFESHPLIDEARRFHDIVVFDRYVASNMVYHAAKVGTAEAHAMMKWVLDLETSTFRIPPPELNILIDTPLEMAMTLMAKKKQRSYTHRAFDKYEADLDLQSRVRENYRELAKTDLIGAWEVIVPLNGKAMREPTDIADEIATSIVKKYKVEQDRRYA